MLTIGEATGFFSPVKTAQSASEDIWREAAFRYLLSMETMLWHRERLHKVCAECAKPGRDIRALIAAERELSAIDTVIAEMRSEDSAF